MRLRALIGQPTSLAGLATCLALSLAGSARADVSSQLTAFEDEARQLGTDLPKLIQPAASSPRRLVDAQLLFSLGDYDTAALALFDLASKPGSDQETATYYLGESLFQKGDKGAARSYFAQVAKNTASKYYQPSLQRLVEIAIVQNDITDGEAYLAVLDRSSAGLYIRGKWSFAQGKLDDALTYFRDVPKDSEYELQAEYFTGATFVAKKDAAAATELFTALIDRKPKSAGDRRVIELSQLALGRLFYERDQMGKSIDAYLMIDRHSDLFPDALYEVAWVYVKSKQYDKALRALELLSQSSPESSRTATLRILEGNLRVRKAQMIRAAQVEGTLGEAAKEDPAVEYDKAAKVFAETHDMYDPSYRALVQMIETKANPEQFLAQIAGRSSGVFQISPPLPEAAVMYLRDEPAVQRSVVIESDLGEIEANIAEAEATIARLEAVIAMRDRSAVYPALASRRNRIGGIQDELIKLRSALADKAGNAGDLTATRKQLVAQYAAMPSAEQAFSNLVTEERAQCDTLEKLAAEIRGTLDSTQAMAVALRKYASDPPVEGATAVPADIKTSIDQTIAPAASEAAAIDAELAEIQRELTLGRDLAGVGNEAVTRAREARRQVKAALDAEQRAQKPSAQAERAMKLADQLEQIEKQIDSIVDQGLETTKGTLSAARTEAAGYKTELAEHQAESRTLGGTALTASFAAVRDKIYDIVIRSDVGSVDVVWSQTEDTEDELKRLQLLRARELKQLKDEFKGIIDEGTSTPATPKPPTGSTLPPASTTPAPSPDQGGADTRVKPGGDQPKDKAAPTVQPDTKRGGAR
ncbi:MAG: tetratricopeptide repeat protein [Kofleriaceae bacterium]